MKKLYVLLFLALFLSFFGVSLQANETDLDKDNVLIIDTFNSETPWSNGLFRGIKSQLEKSGYNINLYIEYLDIARFPNVIRNGSFQNYLTAKYAERPLKAVVAMSGPAIEFVNDYAHLLPMRLFFMSTPIQIMTALGLYP